MGLRTGDQSDDIGRPTMIISTVVSCVALLTIPLRLWARYYTTMSWCRFNSGDWCMVANGVIIIFHICIRVVVVGYGLGRHIDTVPRQMQIRIGKIFFVESISYLLALFFLKQSILSTYLALTPSQSWRTAVLSAMAFNAASTLAMILLGILQCNPIEGVWRSDIPDRQCLPTAISLMTPPAFNILAEVIVLLLPVPIIITLKTTLSRKLRVFATLAIGLLSIIISCVRYASFRPLFKEVNDTTYAMAKILLTSSLEIAIATIAGNAPALKGLYTYTCGSCRPHRKVPTPGCYELSAGHAAKSRSRSRSRSQSQILKTLTSVGVTMCEQNSQEDLVRDPMTGSRDGSASTSGISPATTTGELNDPGNWRPEKTEWSTEVAKGTMNSLNHARAASNVEHIFVDTVIEVNSRT